MKLFAKSIVTLVQVLAVLTFQLIITHYQWERFLFFSTSCSEEIIFLVQLDLHFEGC